LSATLPASRRRELLAAYAGDRAEADVVGEAAAAEAYPLLTAVASGGTVQARHPRGSARETAVRVERLADDPGVLADRLESELSDGGCVLVIRNTVRRVLETARVLRDR